MADLADIVGAMAQSGIGKGFSQMGADLGAGGIGEGQIEAAMSGGRGVDPYTRGASAGMDLVKKRLEARKLRDEAVARDRTLEKMTAAFPDMPPEMVDVMANTMIGGMGSDFSSTMTGAKTAQQMDLQRKAAAASDPNARNAILEAMHGQPVDRTRITSGTAYNPTVAPTDPAQAMVTTPDFVASEIRRTMVADSQIDRNQASARNYDSRVTDNEDREARKVAQREAQKVADQARMDGSKISKAQERMIAEAMLSGTEWQIKDETKPSFKNIKTNTSGNPDTVPNANPGRGPAAATTGMSTPVQTDGNVATPKTRAEYDALPSGARYLAPDGSLKIKK